MSMQRGHVRDTDTPSLRRLNTAPDSTSQTPNVDIILVPEYGSASSIAADEWEWLSAFSAASSVVPQVLVYNHGRVEGSQSLWQNIGNAGIGLLQALQGGAEFGIATRPFVIVAHGLGGVIMKQAISDLHNQDYIEEAHRIMMMHAGDVLLGTPHLTTANLHRRTQQMRSWLKSSTKIRKAQLDQAVGELNVLAAISERFEQLSVSTKVLNVYEARSSRFKKGLFSSKQILIDKDTAEIGTPNETLVGGDVTHATITEAAASPEVHQEYTALLRDIVSNPPVFDPNLLEDETSDEVSHAPWSTVYGDDSQGPSKLHSTQRSSITQDIDGLPPAHGAFVRRNPQLPCYVLDPHVRDSDFLGRDDIFDTLAKTLIPGDNGQQDESISGLLAVALTGLGGIGKTSIAAEFAFRYQKAFDAIFIVHADNEDILAQEITKMALKLGLIDGADAGNSVVGRSVFMQWLSNPEKTDRFESSSAEAASQARWLLIFDNADDLDVLERYWPFDGIGSVIVTSRNPDADRTRFYSIQSLEIDRMSMVDATAMLFRITKYASNASSNLQASALASRLDSLPLALQQISSYLRKKDMNFSEVLSLLDDETTAKRLHAVTERSGHTLATVWASQSLDKPSSDLLQVLAFLDPDAVPEFLFKPARPVWPGHNDSFHASEMAYVEARTLLHRYSLIKRNRDLNQLTVHRLVQDVARVEMDDEASSTQFELVVRLVREGWPVPAEDFMHDASLWPQQSQVARQVGHVHTAFEKHPHWRISDEARFKLAEVMARCSWYNHERGNFKMAKRLLDLPLSIASSEPDAMMPLLADVYFQKAWTAAEMVDRDTLMEFAEKHKEVRLKLEKTTKPALTQSSAMAYSILALAYLLFNQFEEVIPVIEDGLKVYDNAPETDKSVHWPHFFIIHHAWALVGLGKADEAIPMLEETVAWGAMRFRKTGAPSFKHAYALQTLASIKFIFGDYEECFSLNQKARRFYQETVGINMHHVGDVYTKLAECKIKQSQPKRALPFAKAAIDVYSPYPYYNAQLARALFIQGTIQDTLGESTLAEESHEQATDLYLEITRKAFKDTKMLELDDFTSIVPIWAR